jgi:hypothetical protein
MQMIEERRTNIRALIHVGPNGGTRYTLDLDLEDAEIKIAHNVGGLDFRGLAGVRPPLLTKAERIGLEGRTRCFAAHLDSRVYEHAVSQEFDRVWLGFNSGVDDSVRRMALNFWLAAHGLGPYMPHPIEDHCST